MLKLTKRTEYGLIALVDLALRPGQVISVREIGERQPVPKRLTGEALKALAHAGLVESARGAGGGFWLTRSPDEISLGEVVAALEGAPALTTRKFLESDFEAVALLLDRTVKLAQEIQAKSGPKLKDFQAALVGHPGVKGIKDDVNKMATSFPFPSFDPAEMKYKNISGPDAA